MDIADFPSVPFHIRDAETHGLTRSRVRHGVAAGLLVAVGSGVYRRVDAPDSVELRVLALRCSVAADQVVVDRTAAWLHGVDAYALRDDGVPPPIETCSLRGHRATRRRELDSRERDLLPEEVADLDGLRVTTPLRTALDLGCHLRRREAFAAMCLLAGLHGLTASDLVRELRRFRRRRAVIQCRELASLVEPRVESHREAWVLLEIHDQGLPRPEPQWWVEIDGVPTYRLDFAYPSVRVCVEYDGAEFHTLTESQRQHDAERRRWLRENGWTVIVVRRGDFTGRALDRWVGRLERALGSSYTNRRWAKW
ncbi:DUF559 domain-containing protein [Nocardioides sp. R1-1]|uniref:DUF559 domain-containing protein n=1 Tax=Nocardioides sp. R1-1 TaxID=3383502 RepID=UPI0038CFAAD6